MTVYAAPHDGQVGITRDAVQTLGDAHGMLSAWDAATMARQLHTSAVAAAGHAWGVCKWCPAVIVWALSRNGSGMPFDPGDHEAGEFAARWDENGKMHVRACKVGQPLDPGEHRVMTHFATCPRAKDVPRSRDRR